jgi:tetratricopeptide (TPR) repeat protein
MTNLARAIGVVGLLLCLTVVVPAEAQWRRIDSPNFVVMGDVGESNLRDVAVKFEAFREMLSRLLGESLIATPVPTVVFVFPHDRAFTPFKRMFEGKPVEAAGLFVPRRDINYILIVSDGRPDRFRVVFHEFVHLVVSNTGKRVPVWLNEGLAELYSTFEIYKGGREALLGSLIDHHLAQLNEMPLLPLDQLLAVDHDSPLYNEGNRRSLFYAQSWALTHLIMLGGTQRTNELGAYVNQLSQGVPAKQAWQQAFGTADIARELDNYVRRQDFKGYRFKFSDKVASFDAAATKMSRANSEALLADYLVRQQRLDEAARRVAEAAKLDADKAALEIVRAQIDIAKGDYEAADKRLRPLSPPADWLAAYLAGVAVAELNDEKPGRPERQDIDAARRLFDAAAAGRPAFANALARMVSLEISSGSTPSAEARAAIERARSLAPGRHEYALIHAQVLARQSDFAAARAVLGPLMTGSYSEQIRDAARRVMGYVVELENFQAASESRKGSAGAPSTVPVPPIVTATPDPPPPIPGGKPDDPEPAETKKWIYREVQAGEQRLEGTLDRIDCSSDGRPVFNLKTPTGVVTFVATELAAVDLIAYRDDLKGSVGCGPFKQPIPVYVTWRPAGGGSSARIAVAIEFLPKSPDFALQGSAFGMRRRAAP